MAKPPGSFPMHIAKDYKDKLLKEVVLPMETNTLKMWDKRLKGLVERADSTSSEVKMDDISDKISRAIRELKSMSGLPESRVQDIAKDSINQTKKFSIKQVDNQIKAIAGVKPHLRHPAMKTAIKTATKENVRLIKSIPSKYFDDVERAINEGVMKGQGLNKIKENLLQAGAKSSSKASLIARDQVGKVMSRVTRERQTQAGVKHYIWTTVGDGRVRPSHQSFAGNRYSWKEGSPEGHPGEPIQCRCIALPDEKEVMENWGQGASSTATTLMAPEQMVDDAGNIDNEAVEQQVKSMTFEDEYKYKLDVADSASNKRIKMAKDLDNPTAKKIKYTNFDTEDYHLVDYTIKRGNTTYNESRRIPDDLIKHIDEFNDLPDGNSQVDYVENIIKPKIDELSEDIATWDRAKGYSNLKRTFEDYIEMAKKDSTYQVKLRDIVLNKKNDIDDMSSLFGKRREFSISVDPVRNYEIDIKKLRKAENIYKRYASESLDFSTDNLQFQSLHFRELSAGSRASAYSSGTWNGMMKLPSDSGVKTILHEMSHITHRNSGSKFEDAVDYFFKKRTRGAELTEIYPEIKNNNELGYNVFFNHYAGKVYDYEKQGAEIVAMGVPEVIEKPVAFKSIDKEHYNLMIAFLEGLF